MSENTKRILYQAGMVALLIVGLWAVVTYLLPFLLPSIIGLAMAWLVKPAAAIISDKLHISRRLSAFICSSILIIGCALLVFFLARRLYFELSSLAKELPVIIESVSSFISRLGDGLGRMTDKLPEPTRDFVAAVLENAGGGNLFGLGELSGKLITAVGSFAGSLPSAFLFIFTTILAIYFAASEYEGLRAAMLSLIPKKSRPRMTSFMIRLKDTLGKWLKAQFKLMGVTFIVLTAGFLLLKINFAVLLAALIAVIDALPVFGTGTILIPWAVISFLRGDFLTGISLAVIYGIAAILRNILEPRLLGKDLDVSPFIMLTAMYFGYSLLGVKGMILMPILTILIINISKIGVFATNV